MNDEKMTQNINKRTINKYKRTRKSLFDKSINKDIIWI